jgi:SAM-dependent methyltransferase
VELVESRTAGDVSMSLSTTIPVCPLSNNGDVVLLETIKVKDLIALYQRELQLDVSINFKKVQDIGLYHCTSSDLRFFYPAIAGSSQFYDALQKVNWYYLDDKDEYDYACQFVAENSKVLEIGCGKAVFAQKLKTSHYTGLELSELARSKAIDKGIETLNESIHSHARNHASEYDVVCAFQVLEHVPEMHAFIQSSLDCLKPGGYLIYSVPSYDSFLAMARNNVWNLPPHHVSWWSDRCLSHLGQQFSLTTISIYHEPLSKIHWVYYLTILITSSIHQYLGIQVPIINLSFFYRLLTKLSKMLAQGLASGFSGMRGLPQGHSVTVVYQKTE